MNIGILKIGIKLEYGKILPDGTIVETEDKRGAFGEAKALIDMLYNSGNNLTLFTKVDNDSYIPKEFASQNLIEMFLENDVEEFTNIDKLVVINGSESGPIGSEESLMINAVNHWAINRFNGDVYYLLCDPELPLKKDVLDFTKGIFPNEDFRIVRDDIKYIVQPRDVDALCEIINSDEANVPIKRENMEYFPFEKFPCIINNIFEKNPEPEYDMMYGGSIRVGRRAYKIAKFLYGYPDKYKVSLFGKMDENILKSIAKDKFDYGTNTPEMSGLIDYNKFCEKMNSSLSTVIIGDEIYEKTSDIAQRCYESMIAQVVTFIDIDLDKDMTVFGGNEFLKEFMYVHDRHDIEIRIDMMKDNPEIRDYIISYQNKLIDIDKDDYCRKFSEMLNK